MWQMILLSREMILFSLLKGLYQAKYFMSNQILLFFPISSNHTKKQTFWVSLGLMLLIYVDEKWTIDLYWSFVHTCIINNWQSISTYFSPLEITCFYLKSNEGRISTENLHLKNDLPKRKNNRYMSILSNSMWNQI